MFARFCGFGPGHKSTHVVTKVFRDEIKEAFGFELGDISSLEGIQPDNDDLEDDADEKDLEDDLGSNGDSDSESEENNESEGLWDHGDDLDYFNFEEELGYAPL
jgi:hypothetical protein